MVQAPVVYTHASHGIPDSGCMYVCINTLGRAGLPGGPVGKANKVSQSLEGGVGGVRVKVQQQELSNRQF